MLPDYGVVIGNYVNYTTNQGQWMHVDLNIQAADLQYQAAVDVNEPNGLFQFQVFNNLDAGLFAPILALPLGDHFKSGQRLSVQNRPTEVAVPGLSCSILSFPIPGRT